MSAALLTLLTALAQLVALALLGLLLFQQLFYAALLGTALLALVRRPPQRATRGLWSELVDVAPSLTIIVPAHDEEATIVDSVRALLALQYPRFEVVVVDDGSRDGTLARLKEAFALEPIAGPLPQRLVRAPVRQVFESRTLTRLTVITKANGGKSDALNAGLELATGELVCSVDADSLLESDSLLRAVEPFVRDETTLAVGGTVRVANGCRVEAGRVVQAELPRRWLPRLQAMEYIRAFVMARLAFAHFGALTIVSGAFGLFRRDVLLTLGGYRHDTVGEDFELVVRIHRYARERGRTYAVHFVPEPVCWTQAPERWRDLARQRIRWHRGALETFFAHADMLAHPRRYGAPALLGLGTLLLIDVVGPAVELLGWLLLPLFWSLGGAWLELALAWVALAAGGGIALSCGALVLEELELARVPRARDLLRLALAGVVENLGYRQFINLCRIIGHLQWLRGATGWGRITRRRFDRPTPAETPP